MKKRKPEDVIFAILVFVSLISIVYCVATTVVETVKDNPISLDDTLFVSLKPSIELAKRIPQAIDSASNAYKIKEYDDECTISKVEYDTIEVLIGNHKRSYNLTGVELKYDVLGSRLKEGDMLHIDYVGLNANLYFRDGTMIQHWLLLNGYAIVSEEGTSDEEFEQIQEMARERKVGYWAD